MFLNKLSMDAITKRYRNGELSPEALKKLQQSGAIRPIDRYIEGINKGTNRILDRNAGQETIDPFLSVFQSKAKTKRIPIEVASTPEDVRRAFLGGGYINETNERILKVNPDNFFHRLFSPMLIAHDKEKSRLLDAIATRHEALEEVYGTKNNQKILNFKRAVNSIKNKKMSFWKKEKLYDKASKKNMLNYGVMLKEVNPSRFKILNKLRGVQNVEGKYYRPVGIHHDPRVLTREADLVSKIPYPEYTKKIRALRDKTGERQYLTRVLGQDPYTKGLPSNTNRLLVRGKNIDTLKEPYSTFMFHTPEKQFHVVSRLNPSSQSRIGALLSKVKGMFR